MMFSIHQLPCQINTMVNEKKKCRERMNKFNTFFVQL